jgi:hypothetical protein
MQHVIEENLEDTFRITVDTVEALLDRGETLCLIRDQSAQLAETSQRFLWQVRPSVFVRLFQCFSFLFPTEEEIERRIFRERKNILNT